MDEKMKQALLKGARKLVQDKAADEDIIASLQEIGASEGDAKSLLLHAKEQTAMETELQGKGEKKQADNPWRKSIAKRIEEEKSKYISARAGTDSGSEEEGNEQEMQFVPSLRTGGREKVREIIVESVVGRKEISSNGMKPYANQDAGTRLLKKIEQLEEKVSGLEKGSQKKKHKKTKRKSRK